MNSNNKMPFDSKEKARDIIRHETGRFDGNDQAFNHVADKISGILEKRRSAMKPQSWLKTYQVIVGLIQEHRLHITKSKRRRIDDNKILLKYRMKARDMCKKYKIAPANTPYLQRQQEIRICRLLAAADAGTIDKSTFETRLEAVKIDYSEEILVLRNLSWQQFLSSLEKGSNS